MMWNFPFEYACCYLSTNPGHTNLQTQYGFYVWQFCKMACQGGNGWLLCGNYHTISSSWKWNGKKIVWLKFMSLILWIRILTIYFERCHFFELRTIHKKCEASGMGGRMVILPNLSYLDIYGDTGKYCK